MTTPQILQPFLANPNIGNATATSLAMATGVLKVETINSGGTNVPAYTITFGGIAGNGFGLSSSVNPAASGQFVFPATVSAGGAWDGLVDFFRGDYGWGTNTLNFEGYGPTGGFVFVGDDGGLVIGANSAIEPFAGTETLGTATNGWSVLNLKPQTLAQLGSAATAGAGALGFCTDALVAPSGTVYATAVTGSGSFKAKVYSDGTNWLYG